MLLNAINRSIVFRSLEIMVLSFFATLYAKELVPIAGDISDIAFDTVQQYYWVKETIEVPPDRSVKIPAGVVLMFDSDASMLIHGRCEIEGTENNPVYLTSINDTIFSIAIGKDPSPYDWQGIHVGNNAGIAFRNVHLRYVQSPLEIDSACSTITLEGVTCFKSVNPGFLIDGKLMEVNTPFYYQKPQFIPKDTQPVPLPLPEQKQVVWYKTGKVRWTTGAAVIATALASGGCLIGAYVNYQDYKKENDIYRGLTGDNIDRRTAARENYQKADKKSARFKKAAIINGIASGVFLAGLGVTFLF